MSAPDFVVVGHAARDLAEGGWRLGGTVTFAAAQAHRLGLSVGIVTRTAGDLGLAARIPFAEIVDLPSPATTTFENVYERGQRRQHIRGVAAPIAHEDVPPAWRSAPIVLLGPVMGELEPHFARAFATGSLCGVSAQGWLRASDPDGRVRHTPWLGDPFWTGCRVLFVSDEDLADGQGQLDRWTADVPIVAMTESWRGARVYADGAWRRIDAFPEQEVDPTGAGDTFATAFLIRLHETGDAGEATRFGAAAASLSVSGIGAAAMPSRAEVDERLRQYPGVMLR
ncbi:MAG TPA: PfkB family carbohydrate kinase [Dehalococcoidia bacterium]|nr:PfkB family carbohydrate kinase [Dehalococcoidia bacterium]